MAIDDDVRAVYEYLTTQVLPGANQTDGHLDNRTRYSSPDREHDGHIGRVLERFRDAAPTNAFHPFLRS